MWIRLDNESLVPRYEGAFSGRAPASPMLVGLLRELSRTSFAASVWAVTTHGHLRLTTAPSYKVERAHGSVHVTPRGQDCCVSYLAPDAVEPEEEEVCRADELRSLVVEYVQRYLLAEA